MENENAHMHNAGQLHKNTLCIIDLMLRDSIYRPKKKYIMKAVKNIKEKMYGKDILFCHLPQFISYKSLLDNISDYCNN